MVFRIEREKNESSQQLTQRFLMRIRKSGILNTAKKKRFYLPKVSKNAQKKSTLRYLRLKKEREEEKLGLGE
jgi:ribosomal protein S21